MIDTTVHDRSGLLLGGAPAPTDAEVNQAELVNIGAARAWLVSSRMDVTKLQFWRKLHQKMFGEVWQWAGEWRLETRNIGRPPHEIQPELHKLQGDLAYWLSANSHMDQIEILSRFHHRSVWVHPFNDGNGRWSRLATDALAVKVFKRRFLNWESGNDPLHDPVSPERQEYIAVLRAGDNNDFRPLAEYLRARN